MTIQSDRPVLGWALVTLTFLLVVLGCGLYLIDQVGWAQLAWVFASGTSGAGIVLILTRKEHDELDDGRDDR